MGVGVEKIIDYFVSITGGKLMWQHINKTAIKNYILYSAVFAFVAFLLSILISPIFYAVFFLLVSIISLLAGVSAFYSDKVRAYLLNPGSTIDDVKYTLFFLIYTGVCGLLLMLYVIFMRS